MSEIIFISIIAGLVWWILVSQKRTGDVERAEKIGSGLAAHVKALAEQKAKYKVRIIALIKETGRVTNDDIQKALGVSDATATRYCDELEREGIIVQKGTDQGAHYLLQKSYGSFTNEP